MTTLPAQTQLSLLGIDILERAIAFSALLLRQANTDPLNAAIGSDSPYFSAVQLAFQQTALLSGIVQIQAKIPFLPKGLVQAAALIDNVLPFSAYTNDLSLFPSSPPAQPFPGTTNSPPFAGGFFSIPGIPNNVDTLEKYFVWAVNKWHKSIAMVAVQTTTTQWTSLSGGGGGGGTASVSTTPKSPDYVYNPSAQCTLNLNDDYSNYQITATMPFDWFTWSVNQNLIASMIHVGTVAV